MREVPIFANRLSVTVSYLTVKKQSVNSVPNMICRTLICVALSFRSMQLEVGGRGFTLKPLKSNICLLTNFGHVRKKTIVYFLAIIETHFNLTIISLFVRPNDMNDAELPARSRSLLRARASDACSTLALYL